MIGAIRPVVYEKSNNPKACDYCKWFENNLLHNQYNPSRLLCKNPKLNGNRFQKTPAGKIGTWLSMELSAIDHPNQNFDCSEFNGKQPFAFLKRLTKVFNKS